MAPVGTTLYFCGRILSVLSQKLNSPSDGDDRSVFVVKVFRTHSIGKDELVGFLSDTIGNILGKCTADNGTMSFYVVAFY
jgi:hypothetical protein